MNVCTFNKDGRCVALKDKNCKDCAFMKTDKEFYESRAIAWLRLSSLPEKSRAKIQHKYYGKPVKEG